MRLGGLRGIVEMLIFSCSSIYHLLEIHMILTYTEMKFQILLILQIQINNDSKILVFEMIFRLKL